MLVFGFSEFIFASNFKKNHFLFRCLVSIPDREKRSTMQCYVGACLQTIPQILHGLFEISEENRRRNSSEFQSVLKSFPFQETFSLYQDLTQSRLLTQDVFFSETSTHYSFVYFLYFPGQFKVLIRWTCRCFTVKF